MHITLPLLPSARIISVYSLLVHCFLQVFIKLLPRDHYLLRREKSDYPVGDNFFRRDEVPQRMRSTKYGQRPKPLKKYKVSQALCFYAVPKQSNLMQNIVVHFALVVQPVVEVQIKKAVALANTMKKESNENYYSVLSETAQKTGVACQNGLY